VFVVCTRSLTWYLAHRARSQRGGGEEYQEGYDTWECGDFGHLHLVDFGGI